MIKGEAKLKPIMAGEMRRDDGFEILPPAKKKKNNDGWALSYGDMVTVLLCFFIIFYAIEKQIEKKTKNPVKGYSESEGILEEHKDEKVDTEYKYMVERLSGLPFVVVKRTSSFVDVYFQEIVFFNKGSAVLTEDGKKVMAEFLKKVNEIKSVYRLEIQGHADKTPVRKMKSRWWKNNMELSVLRALSVYSYFIEHELPKDQLSVAGFGTNQRINPDFEEVHDLNRRISLRIQLVENES